MSRICHVYVTYAQTAVYDNRNLQSSSASIECIYIAQGTSLFTSAASC